MPMTNKDTKMTEEPTSCDACGASFTDDGIAHSDDGGFFCVPCFEATFAFCTECNSECERRDTRHTSVGMYYCDLHANTSLATCIDCDDDTDRDDIKKGLCPPCYEQWRDAIRGAQ